MERKKILEEIRKRRMKKLVIKRTGKPVASIKNVDNLMLWLADVKDTAKKTGCVDNKGRLFIQVPVEHANNEFNAFDIDYSFSDNVVRLSRECIAITEFLKRKTNSDNYKFGYRKNGNELDIKVYLNYHK